MALQTFTGSLAQPGVTGNQAKTGIGFQPKIVLFFGNKKTADGSAGDSGSFLGAATSSTDRRVAHGVLPDNVAAASLTDDNSHTNLLCIRMSDGTGSGVAQCEADFVSMDADGFTVNWTKVDATARIVNFLAIGGTDLTNVKTGGTAMITGTGNASVTGMGFKPDFMMFWIYRVDTTDPAFDANNSTTASFGFASSASARGTSAFRDAFANPILEDSFQQSNRIFVGVSATPGVFSELDIVSFDADGFTYNAITGSGGAYFFYWIALKGGQYKVGTFNQKTSTGSQATTGVGFQPTGLILSSMNKITTTGAFSGGSRSFGVGTDSTHRGSIWQGEVDNVATSNSSQNLDRANIIKMMTASHTTPSTQAAADLTSLDSDGFTLNWGTADATAREIIYAAIGSNIKNVSYKTLLGVGQI